jgi:hypothetical protein
VFSKHLLLRPRQRKPAPVRVEACDPRLLRLARKPAALPHIAVAKHRQRFVHHGVAVAEARGGAFGVHLEGAAVVELAIGWAPRLGFHCGDVAAEDVLLVIVEILARDLFWTGTGNRRGRIEHVLWRQMSARKARRAWPGYAS